MRRNPMMYYLAGTVLLLLVGSLCAGCAMTTYNIDFHEGAFRVADEMTIEPGQGGDSADSSTTAGGPTSGGEEASPGGSNLLRGFAQQGNIFQIGTSAKPTTTTDAKASATVQSPNSQTGVGGNDGATGSTPTVGTTP